MSGFTVMIFDNDFGDFMSLKNEINAVIPRIDIDSSFDLESMIELVTFFETKIKDLNSIGVFIIEAKFSEGDPVDLIRKIKKSTRLKSIPIVIFTGTNDEDTKQACVLAGAQEIFTKTPGPRDVRALVSYVAKLVPNHN